MTYMNRHQISCHFTVKQNITRFIALYLHLLHYHLTPDSDLAIHVIVFIFYFQYSLFFPFLKNYYFMWCFTSTVCSAHVAEMAIKIFNSQKLIHGGRERGRQVIVG